MARRFRRVAIVPALLAIAAGALPASTVTAAATVPPQPIPAHVYSPYFETWTADTLTGVATASGVRYFTLAFLETTSKTSCTLASVPPGRSGPQSGGASQLGAQGAGSQR